MCYKGFLQSNTSFQTHFPIGSRHFRDFVKNLLLLSKNVKSLLNHTKCVQCLPITLKTDVYMVYICKPVPTLPVHKVKLFFSVFAPACMYPEYNFQFQLLTGLSYATYSLHLAIHPCSREEGPIKKLNNKV